MTGIDELHKDLKQQETAGYTHAELPLPILLAALDQRAELLDKCKKVVKWLDSIAATNKGGLFMALAESYAAVIANAEAP